MDDQTKQVDVRPDETARAQEAGAAALGRGGRMSRQRKTAAVLRLLRGEDLDTVSRSLGVRRRPSRAGVRRFWRRGRRR